MTFIRLYLFAGLIAHKLVWEVMKHRQHTGPQTGRPRSAFLVLLKTAKLVMLVGVVAQTMVPEILPIMEEPLPLRLIGVPLYTLGLIVAILGRWQLGENWVDIEVAQILPQQSVVATGVYRYIRHPIYIGDLVMLLGLELTLNSWLVLGVGALAPYVVWRAVGEERMLSAQLPGYDGYCARTWRFVPFVV
jgi:protein-S-isoprenylcysteine O-methyltransferase Ste14